MRTIKTEAKRGTNNYVPGRFVSLKELYEESGKCVPMAHDACSVYLEEFVNTREAFRVSSLQHVTTAECAERILQSQRFLVKGDLSSHGESANKSWWSAVAPEGDFRSWQSGNLEKCFLPSPAFTPDVSRYGNFKFSFPLAELISAYKKQYCGGGEPNIRVYGTKLFLYEISHVVLIHSPDTDHLFDDLPLVPSVKRQPDLPTDLPQSDLPTDLPQPNLPTDLPQSDLPTDLPQPDLPTDLPQPNLPTDLPQSDLPTDLPQSDLPTDLPQPNLPTDLPQSDLPTDLPQSDLPTDLPQSDLPTDLPQSDLPTDLPQSDLPTDLPQSDLPTDLPQSDLPTDLPQSELPYINPVVYDKESHEIIWSPESKATSLRIQNNLGTWNRTYKCVWNHLEVVFHLPKAEGLHLPLHNLLGHLSTCDTICYLQRPDTQKSKAEADSILEYLKKKYTKAITESSTEINRRPLTERSLNCMRDLEGERGGKRKEKKHHTGESKKLKRF
ncbi:uncharacterized protein LOC128654735 [Bombina bombina]|uniref:uncharacterized protein LOC128654735 n=1 Tax=Bombina bombina TaxID=8345 RepID=UPI00235A8190|nr:uncharacterized protein LOC128654735 [Bombina bombina]